MSGVLPAVVLAAMVFVVVSTFVMSLSSCFADVLVVLEFVVGVVNIVRLVIAVESMVAKVVEVEFGVIVVLVVLVSIVALALAN